MGHSLAYRSADATGSLRHRAAARSSGDGSGEVAADRGLHVQRLSLPLRRNTAA